MANATEEQPKPAATNRRPMWPEVINYVERNYANGEDDAVTKLVTDMKARDQTGRERYGVPLTSKNGRDHLVDAYQEALDFAVYLRTWLDEHGIEPMTPEAADPTDERPTSKPGLDEREMIVLAMFASSIEMLLHLRSLLQ